MDTPRLATARMRARLRQSAWASTQSSRRTGSIPGTRSTAGPRSGSGWASPRARRSMAAP